MRILIKHVWKLTTLECLQNMFFKVSPIPKPPPATEIFPSSYLFCFSFSINPTSRPIFSLLHSQKCELGFAFTPLSSLCRGLCFDFCHFRKWYFSPSLGTKRHVVFKLPQWPFSLFCIYFHIISFSFPGLPFSLHFHPFLSFSPELL